MKEEWKDVIGYEGMYQVSNLGRVKSFKRKGAIIMSPSKDGSGYMFVPLSKNGTHKFKKVHRLLAIAFIANPLNKPQVNHIDGIKHNNTINNLEWCTASENLIHARDNNLLNINNGEDCYNSKLTEDDVLEIRSIYDQKFANITDIAYAYGMSLTLIFNVVNRKRWKHIEP